MDMLDDSDRRGEEVLDGSERLKMDEDSSPRAHARPDWT